MSEPTNIDEPHPRLPSERHKAFWARAGLPLVGFAFFLAVVLVGSLVLDIEGGRFDARRKVELISYGSLLQTRLNRDLSSVLYLTSGLNSYLVVREGELNRGEIEAILEKLYADSRHVRNFGIAVGYRITYMYPLKGNEKAIGLYYPDVPAQWPQVKHVIDSGVPVLLGPFDLIQGGRGLVYRVPVQVRGSYWGLISTVIDSDSLFSNVFRDADEHGVDIALRGRDARGAGGDVFFGDASLFTHGDAERIDMDVPGGKWVMALRLRAPSLQERSFLPLHLLVWVLAAFLGWGVYALLLQRARLARLALFDLLTGLPNRSLIQDRLARAISAQRRNPQAVSALLFVDLDGFKNINDRYGHRAGDAVLQGVAVRALRAVRDVDSVGRWGGDELVVVLESTDRQKIPELIQRVRDAVETPIEFAGQSMQVGASIGSAIVPDDGESPADLIRLADRRMYENKQERKLPAG
jgi:diguanylate cyclase (GGDEF)-like protein